MGVNSRGYRVRAWWDTGTVDTSFHAGSGLGAGPGEGEDAASTWPPGGSVEGGVTGASGAQCGPCPASRSLSEFIKGLCWSQTQSSSRPTYQDCRKKTRNSPAKQAVAVYGKRGLSKQSPVLCGYVFPGSGAKGAFGDSEQQGAGGPFCALKFRRQRPTLRLLA